MYYLTAVKLKTVTVSAKIDLELEKRLEEFD